MDRYHVAVAAEASAAVFFARCGYEVSVQYGANQPGYDLVAVRKKRMLKVSVKGSQGGGWGLLAGYKKDRTWHEAADAWAAAQPSDVVMCFVQFKGISLDQFPRIYLARPSEVVVHLKAGWGGEGATSLSENEERIRGRRKGQSNSIPLLWRATKERADSV